MCTDKLSLKNVDPSLFGASQWPISNVVFVFWRFFWLVWHFVWTYFSIQHELNLGHGWKWLIYMTNHSYFMLTMHSLFFFLVLLYQSIRQPVETKWYHSIVWLLTTLSFDTAILVSLLYWTLEYKGVLRVHSIMTHAINSVYVLLDVVLVALPVRPLHMIYTLTYYVFFLVFSITYQLLGGTNSLGEPYIYRALNWNKVGPSLLISSIVICAGVPLVHLFQFACYTCRDCVYRRSFGSGKIKAVDEPIEVKVEAQQSEKLNR